MPDSKEIYVHGQTYRDYENRFGNGQPPTDSSGSPIVTRKVIPPKAPPGADTLTIEEWFYSDVECNPPSETVLETCNNCDGHVHEVKVLFGPVVGTPTGGIKGPDVQDQQHADDDHFGSHLGQRYSNARCRGQEITRTKLTWSFSGRTEVMWQVKRIDHIKNGFVWLSDISNNPCKDLSEHGFYKNSKELEEALAGRQRSERNNRLFNKKHRDAFSNG